MNKKHILFSTLVSIALLTMLYTPLSGSYDPWVDFDEDGSVEYDDLVSLAGSYGSSGPPTKNVNVTNFPLDEEGNLRVAQSNGAQNVTVTNWPTQPEPKTIIVVQNHTITYTGANKISLAKADVSGYTYVSMFVTYYLSGGCSHVGLWILPSCLNITEGMGTSFGRNIPLSQYNYWKQKASTGFVAGAPEVGLGIEIGSGSIELTIVLYCYN